jgi:hypothetical protein
MPGALGNTFAGFDIKSLLNERSKSDVSRNLAMADMRIQIKLHHAAGNCILFEGRPEECPPLPRPGDQVRSQGYAVRIEGIEYIFHDDGTIEVALLG